VGVMVVHVLELWSVMILTPINGYHVHQWPVGEVVLVSEWSMAIYMHWEAMMHQLQILQHHVLTVLKG
jgi:hypothetical protein